MISTNMVAFKEHYFKPKKPTEKLIIFGFKY